jgi:pimeloyl-ACP methyl ester carboxylesterase
MGMRAMQKRVSASSGIAVVVVAVLLTVSALLFTPPASAQDESSCRSVRTRVSLTDISRATLYGKLCIPSGRTPRTVQLLVHGATYNHHYWDFPLQPRRYSYAHQALQAGYATFDVDRLGAGASTRPLSPEVTIESGAEALHQVIGKLRDGSIGPRFRRVAWVGHSLGSITAWIEASRYRDIDAFVLTGVSHVIDTSGPAPSLYPASQDPKFAGLGLDSGYLTTMPGSRGQSFYYAPGADPDVIALDEQLKDTVTAAEGAGAIPLITSPPPQTAPSREIAVPTLLALGQFDPACRPPDGVACTEESMLAAEGPYYRPEAHLQVSVVPDAGHDLQLHLNAPSSTAKILDWLAGALG